MPQRRRRIWLVGHLGADWTSAAQALFDGPVNPQYRPPRSEHAISPAAGDSASAVVAFANNLVYQRSKLFSTVSAWQWNWLQTLTASDHIVVSTPDAIRSLTSIEEERAFGFPDNWTLVPCNGKPASYAARHDALGNSWAVNCAEWVCSRIQFIEGHS